TEALSFPEVPKKLVLIGAGVIGLELGSVWRRLGAEVTVLEYQDRIMPGMDLELAKEAQKLFTRQGMKFVLGAKVSSAKKQGDKAVVEYTDKAGAAQSVEADRVLVAVGRKPFTEGVGLSEA